MVGGSGTTDDGNTDTNLIDLSSNTPISPIATQEITQRNRSFIII